MQKSLLYPIGSTLPIKLCGKYLPFSATDHPSPDVTHLLLDIPSFRQDGSLRNGEAIDTYLERLPQSLIVIGGNLNHSALTDYQTIDLLQDEFYLAQNAQITARCAVRLALPHLAFTLSNCPILVIGWGRIGKCLATLLKNLNADVTVYARKESDRAMITALGFHSAATDALYPILPKFRIVYNTVPTPVLDLDAPFSDNCLKIELASTPGISGNTLDGRKLPGRFAPESSAILIAQTITRIIKEETL